MGMKLPATRLTYCPYCKTNQENVKGPAPYQRKLREDGTADIEITCSKCQKIFRISTVSEVFAYFTDLVSAMWDDSILMREEANVDLEDRIASVSHRLALLEPNE